MLKAVFMDFYGTAAQENSPISLQVIKDIYKNSTAESPEQVVGYWWKNYRKRLEQANGENFKTQREVALEIFYCLAEEFQCKKNPRQLLERMEEHWCTSPVYEDVVPFLQEVSLPVYFVTNSDDRYVLAEIEKYQLKPAGIITSEQAGYSKPRKEIFLYALEKTENKPEEVVHIGDSLESDVKCPAQAGIRSIWLNREGKPVPKGVNSAGNLCEALKCVRNMEKD